MSSSQPFQLSSPISPISSQRRKSRFTYRHLSQLSLSSTSCPLRVIAHIDLDAFYAQCESVRLGLSEDQPLAVQQWQGLIAINYPARKYGLSRHIEITEAKKLCPHLIMQHVATWKEGDEKWAYHQDAFAQIASHKVSLDPYRLESRRILACIKDVLPAAPVQRVEKAGIDEVFVDMSAQIHATLVERFPEVSGPAPYDDPTELLPRPPTTALDWNSDALVDLDSTETEDDDPDWDDIAMLIGSEIVRSVRAAIRKHLKYTCSAGIGRNKMIAKLGSAHKKPNQQTIVRNRAVQNFLGEFKFTKIRNLGGKLGEEIVSKFATDQVKDLLPVPLEQLKSKIGDDTGSWVYGVIRGEDFSEVNSRTQIKSMLSAKSFRPSINTFEQALKWLRIFVSDIFSRLVEEGVLENKRRPKSINLHYRQGAQMRSRQGPIPTGKLIDEMLLFDIAKNLLGQIVVDGRAWPCSNLQLSVGGFEDGPTGNRGISGFLVKGDEAKAMRSTTRDFGQNEPHHENTHPEKRRKFESGGIGRFFARKPNVVENNRQGFIAKSEDSHAESSSSPIAADTMLQEESSHGEDSTRNPAITCADDETHITREVKDRSPTKDIYEQVFALESSKKTFVCVQCHNTIPLADRDEHNDWHFAKGLQTQERITQASTNPQSPLIPKPGTTNSSSSVFSRSVGKKRTHQSSGRQKTERGQKRLVFES
ncbi:DNA-directed DNA polymerase eta rad30 [Pseudocyphellaria aurata]|nr:DNA-directed DNA polymerase eta rad30 [Pseudocyphellaria aurata]